MENVLNKIKFSDDTYIDNHMLIFFITQFSMKQG